MTESLIEALSLLKQGRQDLLQSFIERNSDRYRYSFQYYRSPASLAIASSLLDHQWLDLQIERAFNLHTTNSLSKDGLKLFLETVNKLSILHTETLSPGQKFLLETKVTALMSILKAADRMNQKLRTIEFDYHRDKVLLERDMDKYSQEMGST